MEDEREKDISSGSILLDDLIKTQEEDSTGKEILDENSKMETHSDATDKLVKKRTLLLQVRPRPTPKLLPVLLSLKRRLASHLSIRNVLRRLRLRKRHRNPFSALRSLKRRLVARIRKRNILGRLMRHKRPITISQKKRSQLSHLLHSLKRRLKSRPSV